MNSGKAHTYDTNKEEITPRICHCRSRSSKYLVHFSRGISEIDALDDDSCTMPSEVDALDRTTPFEVVDLGGVSCVASSEVDGLDSGSCPRA